MKKLKTVLALILAFCFVLSIGVLYAGSKEKEGAAEKPAPGEKVVLKFTDWQGGNEGILKSYKELITIFEKENPGYTVDYQQYTVTTYNEFLKPALAGGDAPDLIAVYPGPDFFGIGL